MAEEEKREGESPSSFTILWLDDEIKSTDVEDLEDCLNTPTLQYQPTFRYQILKAADFPEMRQVIDEHLQGEARVDLLLADLILGPSTFKTATFEQVLTYLRAGGLKDLPTIVFTGREYKKLGKDIPLLDQIPKPKPWEQIAERIQENILNINNRRYFREDLFGSPIVPPAEH